MLIKEIISLLEQEYGSLEWKPGREAVDILIATILSQNTSDVNSGRAFNSLISNFDNWETVASAPVEDISHAIRSGGLSQIKAIRIRQVLNKIKEEKGHINLDFLKPMGISEAINYLTEMPGIGPKTASCVLLFGLGKPSLPVDTHVFRLARRLSLIGPEVSAGKAPGLLQRQIPAPEVYQFHLHMIEHGRRVCRSRHPQCNKCVLKEICPSSLASPQTSES